MPRSMVVSGSRPLCTAAPAAFALLLAGPPLPLPAAALRMTGGKGEAADGAEDEAALFKPSVPSERTMGVIHDQGMQDEVNDAVARTSQVDRLADLRLVLFGLGTSPSRVEEAHAEDFWTAWSVEGHVHSLHREEAGEHPNERLRFLAEPEVELDLAAEAGVTIFKMGVDWGRLSPKPPPCERDRLNRPGWTTRFGRELANMFCGRRPSTVDDVQGVTDVAAMDRYREIIALAKSRGLRVLLTLFENSMPAWLAHLGGWSYDKAVDYYMAFAQDVVYALGELVDFWATSADANIYVWRSACEGLWPPAPVDAPLGPVDCFRSERYAHAMENIALAHNRFYDWVHLADSELHNPRIGIAHGVAWHMADDPLWRFSRPLRAVKKHFQFGLVDATKGHLDWLGLNYHGREWVQGSAGSNGRREQASDIGEIVDPTGLLNVIVQFRRRYPPEDTSVRFPELIVSASGVADAADVIRPSFIVEHLLAVREAQRLGIPVFAYIYSAISDGWEWADGYCAKTGLVAVNRSTHDLARSKRASFEFFQEIVAWKAVTQRQRDAAWAIVHSAVVQGRQQAPCAPTGDGLPGFSTRFVANDWRFHGLSQSDTEDGCFFTPWTATKHADGVAVRPGSLAVCATLSGASPSGCRRAAELHRAQRCPDGVVREERRSVVCEAPAPGLNLLCVLPGDSPYACCCDAVGACGVWPAERCPDDLTLRSVEFCAA